jgi:UDPglucose 6-dehydrogenase
MDSYIERSVSVIGQGFVGGSITTVFAERGFKVNVYDKAGKTALGATGIFNSITNLVKNSHEPHVYFVCLPTPMFEDGEADLSIVDSVLLELAEKISEDSIAVIKSTIPPGSTEKWAKKFKDTKLHVVFNPEFLTEANAVNDMRNQNRIVLGGERPWINKVKQLFQNAFPSVPIIKTSSTNAELVKYFTNIHLAARVVLSCELWQICEKLDSLGLNVDYDKVLEYSKYDSRLGGTHMNVPGADGKPGAKGHCFPKDLAALIFLSNTIGFKPELLESIQQKNLSLIPKEDRDWEKMIGRAYRKRN